MSSLLETKLRWALAAALTVAAIWFGLLWFNIGFVAVDLTTDFDQFLSKKSWSLLAGCLAIALQFLALVLVPGIRARLSLASLPSKCFLVLLLIGGLGYGFVSYGRQAYVFRWFHEFVEQDYLSQSCTFEWRGEAFAIDRKSGREICMNRIQCRTCGMTLESDLEYPLTAEEAKQLIRERKRPEDQVIEYVGFDRQKGQPFAGEYVVTRRGNLKVIMMSREDKLITIASPSHQHLFAYAGARR